MLPSFESLYWICIAAAGAYALSGVTVVASRAAYDRRRRMLARLDALLAADGAPPAHAASRRHEASTSVAAMPVRVLRQLAEEAAPGSAAYELLAGALSARLGAGRLKAMATSYGTLGQRARAITALRVLVQTRAEVAVDCLERALNTGRIELQSAAVSLLGGLPDRRAAALLVAALRANAFYRSRIAAVLDAFPLAIPDLLAPLLTADEPLVRFWGATLMQRYPQAEGLASTLVAMTRDPEPLVRKAAVAALALTGDLTVADAIRLRLADETAFVRAHAATTLGVLRGIHESPALLPLLADRDWRVRDAAKHALEAMGTAVTPVVVPFLKHSDAFARNGAAEVLQNLGVFERLLALEAEGPSDPERLETVQLLAQAGGPGMRETMLERLEAGAQGHARRLLAAADMHSVEGTA